jgi:2-phospho-L-lactate/phosphoenolpyruvate guanylyltransferase
MTTVVVPFAGVGGKTRLKAPRATRVELSLAMLADVLAAATAVGPTLVVAGDDGGATLARSAGASPVVDPGGGQGQAVRAALAGLDGTVLVVNADLPCATPADLHALAASVPPGGVALVEARDGTTNALGLSAPELFEPLYGPGSAARFRALGAVAAAVPNLSDDVDTMADLERLMARCGAHTQAVLAAGMAR